MCYSKEVSLIASLIIIINSFILFIKNNYRDVLSISLKYLITGYLFIGFHQLFEFLAIFFQSQLIYKTGLIFSISSMIFNLKSLEIITSRQLGAKYLKIIILLLAIFLYFFKNMNFNNEHFYVRGEDHFLWGTLWMTFFLYWNLLYFYYFIKLKNQTLKKFIILTPFYSLNISFFLASIYSYFGGFFRNYLEDSHASINRLCAGLFTNFEIVFDAPSIWCTFATIQGFFLYYLLANKKEINQISLQELRLIQPSKNKIIFLAIIMVALIFVTLPIFSALSYKMIVK